MASRDPDYQVSSIYLSTFLFADGIIVQTTSVLWSRRLEAPSMWRIPVKMVGTSTTVGGLVETQADLIWTATRTISAQGNALGELMGIATKRGLRIGRVLIGEEYVEVVAGH